MSRDVQSEFDSLSLDAIRRFVSEQRQEDLHLEFKSNADFSKKDIRRQLAIAISGFANSDGGIIVWGVVAKRNPDDIDAAAELQPIENVKQVRSRIESLTGEAINPRVDGVRHREFQDADGRGFLATLVPASDAGPHMAKLAEDRYYKRSGDRFYCMEHFDLEDMFGRRARPRLDLCVRLISGGITYSAGPRWPEYEVRPIIGIRNSGRGIARFPLLRIWTDRDVTWGLDGNGGSGLPKLASTPDKVGCKVYGGGVDHVVHPGEVLEVTA